jgi:tetraacyldisaccharide 4'-kinase
VSLNQQTYRKLISGQSTGLGAKVSQALLATLSFPYAWAMYTRNALYDRGRLPSHRASVPVICVGNLTTGGTGKTPLVVWLCRFLSELLRQREGKRTPCVVLTRAYKSDGGRDEPALLSQQCPDTPVWVNPDRVTGAREAIERHAPRVLVMDDGFQHRRIFRDLDILVIDATAPFGHDRLLPAGLLREHIGGLRRAQAAVITRTDQVSEPTLVSIEARIAALHPEMIVARSCHRPTSVVYADGRSADVTTLNQKRVYAFAGIGNPEAFLETLRSLGASLVGSQLSDDHHHYTAREIETVAAEARRLEADLVITTEKNFAGLKGGAWNSPLLLGSLNVELTFTAGEQALMSLIRRTLGGTIPTNP